MPSIFNPLCGEQFSNVSESDWDRESNEEEVIADIHFTTQDPENIGIGVSGTVTSETWARTTMGTTPILNLTPTPQTSTIVFSTTCFSWKSILKIAFGWYFFPFIIIFAKIFKKEIRI